MPKKKESEQQTEVETTQAAMPEEHLRTGRTFKHQCFKLHLAKFKANASWKYLEPNFRDVEHVHFYHSVNRTGKPQDKCAPVGGHYHKIKIHWDRPPIKKEFKDTDGSMRVYEGPQFECSPPMHERKRKLGNSRRMTRRVVQVAFDAVDKETDDVIQITDDHTHFIEYLGTDIISEQTQREAQDRDRAMIAPMVNRNQMASQAMDLQKLAANASKGTQFTQG